MKKKTRPMFVSERFHTTIYKWGVNKGAGRSAVDITEKLAEKLERELEPKEKKKKKNMYEFKW